MTWYAITFGAMVVCYGMPYAVICYAMVYYGMLWYAMVCYGVYLLSQYFHNRSFILIVAYSLECVSFNVRGDNTSAHFALD